MKYTELPNPSKRDLEAAIEADDIDALPELVLGASMHSADGKWAESICVRLATHADSIVRGAALLGFGHLARLHRELDMERVTPLVRAGLHDIDDHVRGQALSAAEDIEHFTGTTFE